MTSLVDILGSYVAVDDASSAASDGDMIEVDGACEDGASAFGARGVPAPETPEGARDMHTSAGAAGDDGTASTRTTGCTTPDRGVINVDNVSEMSGFSFGARGVPASATAGARGMDMTISAGVDAGGGGVAATPGNAGYPTPNVGAESDILAAMAAGTAAWSGETDKNGTSPGAPGGTGGIYDPTPAPVGSPTKDSTLIKYSYSAEVLSAELKGISTEGKNLEDMERATKQTCAGHGVKIAPDSSMREKGEGGRLVMIIWRCVHGMQNRQTDRQGQRRRSAAGPERVLRKASSQRTGCAFKITARWPLTCPANKHPRLTTMFLEHNHEVDKEAMAIRDEMKAPMSSPRWSVALKYKRSDAEGGGVVAGDPTPPSEGRWKAIAEGGTVQSTLMQMKENGPTVQDRRKLYVDLLKESTAMIAQGVETVDAETLRQIFANCKTQINQAGRIGLGTGVTPVVVVGNPETVRLPAGRRLGNKRHKSSVETRYSATGTRTASQSYNY